MLKRNIKTYVDSFILKVWTGSASAAVHAGVLKLSPASHLISHYGETGDYKLSNSTFGQWETVKTWLLFQPGSGTRDSGCHTM